MRRAVRHRGMTLVELLSVLGIVSVLLGLLAPSLAGAREAARSAACASNVRQVTLANLYYARDHDGRFVAGAARIATENLARWHGARDSTGEAFDPARGALTPYMAGSGASAALRACPTFAGTLEELAEAGLGFEAGAGGYGYNNAFVGVDRVRIAGVWQVRTDEVGARSARVVEPARTIAFADSAFTGRDRLIEYSFLEPRFWPDAPEFRPDPSMHFRHGASADGRATVGWLDGHVSSEAMTWSWAGWSSRLDAGASGLGWTGETDDNALFDLD